MMQLACIVNMVPKWSRLTLRVCVCNEVRQTSFSLASSSSTESQTEKLSNLLKMLRISAKMFHITKWNQVLDLHNSQFKHYLQQYVFYFRLLIIYGYCFRVNQLIREHSSETAITFLYLPTPPSEGEDAAIQYLNMLDTVSANLPPVIFVHGVSTVTSTTL